MAQLTPSSPSQRTSLRAEHPPSANSYGSGIRILIVEDEETLRESCASILSHDGYNVASTGLAREAQNLLRHSVFDVLLLDWYMSEIPGAELLPVALAANPATRVIAVTGKATLASSLEAMRIGAWAYLPKPFSAVNCAALPEPLLESEMFGHRRGAFTGAVRDKPGLLEAADGGTLMLDELVEMPKTIRAKLLRAIQDGVVRRVGSETADAVVNVRFIAATNREPDLAVTEGLLREDLYYRLSVVPIHVPSLRDRVADIELLANSFLGHYWRKYRGVDTPVPRLGTEALGALRAHPWPGNVRELQNVIEHAVVLLEPAAEIAAQDIPFLSIPAPANDRRLGLEHMAGTGADASYYDARDRLLAKFDRQFLTRAIAQAGGNLSKAARHAGIDRTTFYRLMDRHGLERDES